MEQAPIPLVRAAIALGKAPETLRRDIRLGNIQATESLGRYGFTDEQLEAAEDYYRRRDAGEVTSSG